MHPVIWLYALALLNPFGEVQRFLGGALTGAKAAVLLTLLAAFANLVIRGRGVKRSPIDLPLLVFALIFIPSFLWAPDLHEMLLVSFSIVGYFLLNLAMNTFITNVHRARNVATFLLLGVVIVSLLGVVQFVTGKTFFQATGREELYKWDVESPDQVHHYRVLGTAKNPSAFASHFVVAIPLLLSGLLASPGWRSRSLFALMLALTSVTLILTFSRGGLIAAGAGMGIVLWNFMFRGTRQTRRRVFLFLTVFGICVYLFWPSQVTYYLLPVANLGEDVAAQERELLVRAEIGMFIDHPILGVGFGNHATLAEKYGASAPWGPHNIILGILSELGIVGFIPFSLILIQTLRLSLRSLRKTKDVETRALLAGLLGAFVGLHFLGLTHMNYVNIEMWLVTFLLVTVSQVAREEQRRVVADGHSGREASPEILQSRAAG
jgi:putative inorganic carbon (HCO3(-)) transporter